MADHARNGMHHRLKIGAEGLEIGGDAILFRVVIVESAGMARQHRVDVLGPGGEVERPDLESSLVAPAAAGWHDDALAAPPCARSQSLVSATDLFRSRGSAVVGQRLLVQEAMIAGKGYREPSADVQGATRELLGR